MTAIEHARPAALTLAQLGDYTREQIDLIKATLAPETNDLEFQFFMEVARLQGLNPLMRQIHAIMRWDNQAKKKKMVIQTGIDGYRLIAARTGQHVGTTDATFGPANKEGFPSWASVTVKKLVHGHIAEYPATAYWDEYVQTTKEGAPTQMWKGRPKGQLAKCAEALALRKAFPAELSGVYTDTEMEQADSGAQEPQEGPSEVRQESKPTPDNVDREKALQAWASKIGKAGAKLTEMGARDQATEILARFPWRTDPVQAEQAYLALCEAGVELRNARETQQAAVPVSQSDSLPTITQGKHGTFHWPPNDVIRETQQLPPHEEPVDAEFTPDPEAPAPIHDGQRKALMGYLKRAKVADTSEARAAFYAFMAPSDIQPGTNTNSLTFAQARGLLEVLGKMDGDELAATGQEFNAQFMRGQA